MGHESSLLLALDLTGTFAFAVNGGLTAQLHGHGAIAEEIRERRSYLPVVAVWFSVNGNRSNSSNSGRQRRRQT
jgi:hypothetical protein